MLQWLCASAAGSRINKLLQHDASAGLPCRHVLNQPCRPKLHAIAPALRTWRPACSKTKIVATIGPTSCDRESLFRLADAGMSVVRLNMSHGDHASHKVRF